MPNLDLFHFPPPNQVRSIPKMTRREVVSDPRPMPIRIALRADIDG